MTQDYLCITIPEELQKYTKEAEFFEPVCEEKSSKDFGLKPINDTFGNTIGTAYFSDTGELIKKVFYNGNSVKSINNYRNNKLYSQEEFDNGKIIKKILYNTNECKISILKYKYNNDGQIVYIQKQINDKIYSVKYGYDELKRVNSRTICFGQNIITEQTFRYDILDRIVEYKDSNQCIKITKVNQHNDLVSYTITDIIGNKIIVENKFMCSEYIGTDIELNGHKTSIKDRNYINNVMLKKPYTNEDDLDFALSHFINTPKINNPNLITTKRERNINTDKIANFIISNKKDDFAKPVISADKICMFKL